MAEFCAKIPYIGRHFPRTQTWSGGHGVVRMTPLLSLLLVSSVKYDEVSSNALFSVGTGTHRSFSDIWSVGQGTGSAEMKLIVASTRKAPKQIIDNFDIESNLIFQLEIIENLEWHSSKKKIPCKQVAPKFLLFE